MKIYVYYLPVLALSMVMVNASDCNVTIQLWKNFGRVPSQENAASNVGCCIMQGVTCVGESVTKINWTDQTLVGDILPEIGRLTELTSLSLSRNMLNGGIPSNIGNLQKLITLELMANNLTGAIPSEIGQLKRLKTLLLAKNQLSGSIPKSLTTCTELKFLWLGENKLGGQIPPEFELLEQLESLTLSDNQFNTTISSCMINGMSSLVSLDLSNNPKLSGAVWVPSPNLKPITANTTLTMCTDAYPACSSMKCVRPANETAPAWWLILLVVIFWVIILGMIGLYMSNSSLTKGKLTALWKSITGSVERMKNSRRYDDDDDKYQEYDDDDRSVVTKIDGFKQNGDNRGTMYSTRKSTLSFGKRDTITSRSSTYSGIFRRSAYGGEFETDNKKLHTVTEPYTPANDDEIELITGDQVIILEQFEDGWAFGLNKSKNETGVFPLVCLK